MRTSAVLLLAMCFAGLLFPSLATAQEYPQMELFGGFSYARMGGMNLIGWDASGAWNLGYTLGIAVDVGRLNSSETQELAGYIYDVDQNVTTFMAGPRFTSRDPGKLAPFINLLLGVAHASAQYEIRSEGSIVESGTESNNGFSMLLGGGIDYKTRGPFSFRVLQLDYTGFRTQGYWTKGLRLSFGIALRLGSRQ